VQLAFSPQRLGDPRSASGSKLESEKSELSFSVASLPTSGMGCLV